MRPPWCSTICRQMVRPSPVPPRSSPRLELREPLEDALLDPRRDPGALVLDLEAHAVAGRRGASAPDTVAPSCECLTALETRLSSTCVSLSPIDVDLAPAPGRRRAVERAPCARRRARRTTRAPGRAARSTGTSTSKRHSTSARLDLREVEEVVDQPREPLPFLVDDAREPLDGVGPLGAVPHEDVGGGEDRRERRADLVRDHREELALPRVEPLELAGPLLQPARRSATRRGPPRTRTTSSSPRSGLSRQSSAHSLMAPKSVPGGATPVSEYHVGAGRCSGRRLHRPGERDARRAPASRDRRGGRRSPPCCERLPTPRRRRRRSGVSTFGQVLAQQATITLTQLRVVLDDEHDAGAAGSLDRTRRHCNKRRTVTRLCRRALAGPDRRSAHARAEPLAGERRAPAAARASPAVPASRTDCADSPTDVRCVSMSTASPVCPVHDRGVGVDDGVVGRLDDVRRRRSRR